MKPPGPFREDVFEMLFGVALVVVSMVFVIFVLIIATYFAGKYAAWLGM